MRVQDVVSQLEGELLVKTENYETATVGGVIVSDLMSDVLMFEHKGQILVTSLATEQAIRTAHLIEATGVIICNGKAVLESMKKIASELGVSLFSSQSPKFEVAIKLGKILGY